MTLIASLVDRRKGEDPEPAPRQPCRREDRTCCGCRRRCDEYLPHGCEGDLGKPGSDAEHSRRKRSYHRDLADGWRRRTPRDDGRYTGYYRHPNHPAFERAYQHPRKHYAYERAPVTTSRRTPYAYEWANTDEWRGARDHPDLDPQEQAYERDPGRREQDHSRRELNHKDQALHTYERAYHSPQAHERANADRQKQADAKTRDVYERAYLSLRAYERAIPDVSPKANTDDGHERAHHRPRAHERTTPGDRQKREDTNTSQAHERAQQMPQVYERTYCGDRQKHTGATASQDEVLQAERSYELLQVGTTPALYIESPGRHPCGNSTVTATEHFLGPSSVQVPPDKSQLL
jgi:hypothetical protein